MKVFYTLCTALVVIFATVLLFMVWGETTVLAQERDSMETLIKEQYDTVGINDLKNITDQLIGQETRQIIPDFNMERLTKDLSKGKLELSFNALLQRTFSFFMKEVYLNVRIMLQLIVLAIICGILTSLQSSFEEKGVGDVAFFACYVFIIGVMIKSFTYAINIGRDAIDSMVMFMQSMTPMLMTLLISTGSLTSAAIFQPAILFTAQLIGGTVKHYLIPILFFVTALTIVNNISDKFHVSKMIDVLKQVHKWSLGLLLTIFVGVVSVQGFTSSVIDGVAGKTAKYAVNNLVPVVGKILADAVDAVIGCSLILKNAIGITGMICIILICVVPVIKIMALIAVYRITAAVIEPVSDKRIVQSISDLGDSLTMIFLMVLTVAIMFLLSSTVIIGAGNIAAMLR